MGAGDATFLKLNVDSCGREAGRLLIQFQAPSPSSALISRLKSPKSITAMQSLQKTAAPLTILLVEDDDVDAMAVRRMFKRVAKPEQIDLHRASDGEMGLAELELLVRANTPKLVVLLDINMPRMNGHEFMAKLRESPTLRSTPVFILSTSVDPFDVELAYERHVAGYFEKATNFPSDESVGRFLQQYSDLVVMPRCAS